MIERSFRLCSEELREPRRRVNALIYMGSQGRNGNRMVVAKVGANPRDPSVEPPGGAAYSLTVMHNPPLAMGLTAALWAVAISSASAASPTMPVPATATGPWVVEFADEKCLATRLFNRGSDVLALSLEPQPTTEYYSIWIHVPKTAPRLESAQVVVAGIAIEAKGMALQGIDRVGRWAYAVRLAEVEHQRLVTTGQLRVTQGRWASDFTLPNLAKVQGTLDKCVADLLSTWGLSAQAQADLASFPKPEHEPGRYVTNKDYPSAALRRDASGVVEARITVGRDGTGKACTLLKSSGDPDLDAVTCAIFMKRPHYLPARTKQGVAREAPYVVMLRWLAG